MKSIEKLHFKVGLSGIYWDKKPKYTILINDQEICSGQITVPSGAVESDGTSAHPEIQYEEFDVDLEEGLCSLNIRLTNKNDDDVVKDDPLKPDFVIVKDMLLCIRSVEIDDVDLGNLIWSRCKFTGDDPARPMLENCVDLGWNGTWSMEFESPFYIWLLENL